LGLLRQEESFLIDNFGGFGTINSEYLGGIVSGDIMNRKHALYAVLMAFLSISAKSFSMQAKIAQYVANSALISGMVYSGGKMMAKYEKSKLADVPLHVERWARPILVENNTKNAHSVSLKVGNRWQVFAGDYIQMDKCDVETINRIMEKPQDSWSLHEKEQMILHKQALLHERKHYHKNDFGKWALLYGLTTTPLGTKSRNFLTFGLKLIGAVGSNIGYIRYTESEAERSAYMHMSSLDELEVVKKENERWAEDFEYDLRLAIPVEKTAQFDDPERFRQFVEFESFVSDWSHPSYRYHVQLVQDCIDKRKAEEAKLKEVIS